MTTPSVCVVGSLTMNLSVKTERFPRPGESVRGEHAVWSPGGKGVGQAVAAARAGAETSMVGYVGRDDNGRDLKALLRREGVNEAGVLESWSVETGIAAQTVNANAESMTVGVPGANGELAPGSIDEVRIRLTSAGIVVLSLDVPVAAVERAASLARDAGARVVLNVAPAQALPAGLRGLVDVAVVNTHEAEELTGLGRGRSLEDTLEAIAALGLPAVVLTRGPHGAHLITQTGHAHVPAFPVDTIDTTFAGDVFIGVLAADWLLQAKGGVPAFDALPDAVRSASAAGSLATTRHGMLESVPTRNAIDTLLANHAGASPADA